MGVIRVTDVRSHPTDPNKIRVTYSEAFNVAGAENVANYAFTPTITPVYAKALAGNLQVDLHFGTDLAVDGNTHALWRFDELSGPTAADAGPNTYTLTATNGLFDLNGPFKAARSFDQTTGRFLQLTTTTPRTTVLGEWTLEMLVRPTIGVGTETIIAYTGTTANVQAENYLLFVGIVLTGQIIVFWENGVGVDNSITTPNLGQMLVPSGKTSLITIRKRLRTGANYAFDFFLNGVLFWTSPDTNGPDGGTSANMQWFIGRDSKAAGQAFNGSIDTIHFSDIPRSDAYIFANAQSLLGTPVKGTSYALQVSAVSDSATSTAITTANGKGQLAGNNGVCDITISGRPIDGLKQPGNRNVSGDLGKSTGATATPAGNLNLEIVSVTANPTSIAILLNDNIIVAAEATIPSNWTVTPVGNAAPMTVIGVSSGAATVTLTTTEGKIGGSYFLNIPFGVLRLTDGSPLIPPYTQAFTGNGVVPTVPQIIVINDARSFDVRFSEAVVESEALTIANYSISPPLTVSNVTKVSDNRYTITTIEAQTPGQSYLVTVSNLHDLAGNTI